MDLASRNASSSLVTRLLVTKGLRAFGDGYVSLLLPLYLLDLGFTPLQVGVVATTTSGCTPTGSTTARFCWPPRSSWR